MFPITAEGSAFTYIPGGVDPAPLTADPLITFANGPLEVQHLTRPDLRPALISDLGSRSLQAQAIVYLLWADPMDLTDLDRRVAAGDYSDDDFRGSIQCQPQRHWCMWCDHTYLSMVHHPAIQTYPDNPALGERKFEAWEPRRPKRCPVCENFLRSLVLRILEEPYVRVTRQRRP